MKITGFCPLIVSQEAYDFFISKGFVNPRGDHVTDTSSSKSTLLFSPSGFAVTISEHLKD